MEQLLEVLFKNPFLLIILVGFLISVFSKFKKAGGGTNRMPSFGGNSSSASPQQGRNDAERAEDTSEGVSQEWAEPNSYEPSVRFEDTYRTELRPEEAAPISYAPPLQSEPEPKQKQKLHRNELAKGLMWAEILGPPRAKQPLGKRKI